MPPAIFTTVKQTPLTIADGIIQDNEHKLLARVCNELGLQLNFMHNLLYFSLSSSYTKLDELQKLRTIDLTF